MNDKREPDAGAGAEVLEMDKSRDRVKRLRQERAAAELATRFHRAMGWKGTPDVPDGKAGKKGKRKKKR